jgi:hypothetical protein
MDDKKRIWLDDERPMPERFNTHVRTSRDAVALIERGGVEAISLDHDLGDPSNGTGYDVAKFIEEGAFTGRVNRMEVTVHSANPVGSRNIAACINKANEFWRQNEVL